MVETTWSRASGERLRYWWVNHNQSAAQEIAGGFLWSPKREANGARSQYYDNMRIATRGDLVLAYSAQHIGHVGIVTDDAVSTARPTEDGPAITDRSYDGWMLPVAWRPVPQPLRPRAIWPELQPLMPARYSPLDLNGNGAQKAYLTEISEAAFDLLRARCGIEALPALATCPPQFERIQDALDDAAEQAIANDPALDSTEKAQLVQSRRGQGLFRDRVIAVEGSCRLTGVSNLALLVASHIKPWRSCETAAERLDGENGLLLTPSADRLFDRGFISFEPNGAMIISPRLSTEDLRRLRLAECEPARPFGERQSDYLQHHREFIFLS
jgi:hypothetical protein